MEQQLILETLRFALYGWIIFEMAPTLIMSIKDALRQSKEVKPAFFSFFYFLISHFVQNVTSCIKCFGFWLTLCFTHSIVQAGTVAFLLYLFDITRYHLLK